MARLGPFVTSAIRSLWDGKRTLRRKSFQLDAGFKWRRVAVDARGNDCGPKHTIYIALAGLEAG